MGFDLLSDLALGLQTALLPYNLFYCFIGVLLGTLVGVLPGVGPTATIAMLLPLTFSLSPETSLIMLAGIYYGAQYGGSTTAILINLPGEASSAVTAVDGYQMARNGRAGAALATAAIGSFVAGTIATLVIAMLAPPLTMVALQFGPTEYFSLIVLGLVASIALAHGSILKALAMIVLGLLLGMVGTDLYTGMQRYTFGHFELSDGINFVALAVGLFGVSEILRNLEHERGREVLTLKIGSVMPTRAELKASVAPILRGTAIGSILGVLPGGGALLASFASYAAEKKISPTPERFGHGAIEGVAGPEAANNAGAQTSFIPMLTLGIPSNAVMAMMVGAMIIQGIIPGPNVMTERPDLFWGLIASMWVGNVMLLLLNLPLVGLWVRLLTIPYQVLFPAIMVFSAIGVYSINSNTFDVFALLALGFVGYILTKLDCEPAPLLLGFVLGPLLEEHLRRAMMLSRGDPMVFITHPISAGLLITACIFLFVVTRPSIASKRSEVFEETD
ncbi:tripartite tricarboxylate transporter permease [Aminobacter aganoensis]|uniref:TctA family transporter n=1 Tax=Aminobacter aganoensis TaxID=83264 RepID=A0A7X0KNU8_9HYPH|nr:tripartite tricarboxylate transporter permease [Aminobacter aganoensis]MBB6357540.1 TctA family transporter [Aminobacter aganoensis]